MGNSRSKALFPEVVQRCVSTPSRGERHTLPSTLPELPPKESLWTSCATDEWGLLQPLPLLEWPPTLLRDSLQLTPP